MNSRKLSRIYKLLEIPEETFDEIPKITCMGFQKVLVENYKSILEYQDVFIRINTSVGIINICGLNLKMGGMTKDDFVVEGDIETIEFEKIES